MSTNESYAKKFRSTIKYNKPLKNVNEVDDDKLRGVTTLEEVMKA